MSDATQRMHYFQRQMLGAADFTVEQSYHRNWRRRHNLGPHLWGVITGLELVEIPREGDAQFCDVLLMPGMAVDIFGREVLVPAPTRVEPALFAAMAGDQKREVWIAFAEAAMRDGATLAMICTGTENFPRVAEGFRLFAGTQDSALWDLERAELPVGGQAALPPSADPVPGTPRLPADGTMAAQTFVAEDEIQTWLIRLGSLRWDGGAQKFRPVAAPADLMEGRRWAGLNGTSVLSESGALRLAPRQAAADADARDFATLEGRLVVQGRLTAKKDVEIHGGQLRFQNVLGEAENIPLWMQRRAAPGVTTELHLHLGDDEKPDRRLSIGAGADETAVPALAIRGDRKLDARDGKLRLPGAPRQSIDLSLEKDDEDGAYGIGVQNGAAYLRSKAEAYWYKGGKHADAAGDPGAGGSVLLRLDQDGSLFFGARTRQMLNLWSTGYGLGVQDGTLYSRSDFDFAWHRGGAHVDSRGHPGAGGSRLLLLDASGRFFFGNRTQQMLNLWGENYGVGVQDRTFYQRSDADFRWYRGGTHSDLRGNAGGGQEAMRLEPGGLTVSGGVRASGDLVADGDIRSRGQRVPLIDVRSGVETVNIVPSPAGSATGIHGIDVTTALDNYGSATIMVALSDISNNSTATNARWRVAPEGAPQRLAGNRARFSIRFQVDDIDGNLRQFSWIAVFTA
ncbi:hypothetical protein [Roseomonas marmotae]|uniref:Uncharacterized protein n=1 Tax=Roseomonas marmotae TaxID=2768161 RepID=A0ABS3KFB9_9PROT|nr:hypothetical protein [Roseomonas marmotae]MBO1076171.1 hypothetical protein [Roseomonas marmotae]QTI81792.1 hypothetical protein IAI58_20770 [Roseomonas marmotae]